MLSNIIYVFGPSCSGKSSLALALKETLGDTWTYIDRDQLIEEGTCTDEHANACLDEKILELKDRVIIDAQIPWKEKRLAELFFLVFPPLDILLERDTHRTISLKRSEKFAQYAREYVIETYTQLNQMPKIIFDSCFDSSVVSLEEEVSCVINAVEKKEHLQHL